MAGPSMISIPPGMIPAPMMRETHSPASSDVVKPTNTARAVSGFLKMRTVTSVTTPDHPSRAVDQPEHVVAGSIEMLSADAEDLARHQHDFTAKHVVGRHTVFQAMHTAGILRHVAANSAGNLRRRVRRVVEAGFGDGIAHREVRDTRLHDGHAIVEIDFADAVKLRHAEQNTIGEWQGSAG